MWGVSQKFTDATGKDRYVTPALYIDKESDKTYSFCKDWTFDGDTMVKEICKDLGIKKWARILDMAIAADYEDILKILDVMPKYFNKYVGGKKIFTFVSFDAKEADAECEKQRRPFAITSLKNEIKATEQAIKDLEAKKAKLQELENAQAKEDTWEWNNLEK